MELQSFLSRPKRKHISASGRELTGRSLGGLTRVIDVQWPVNQRAMGNAPLVNSFVNPAGDSVLSAIQMRFQREGQRSEKKWDLFSEDTVS